MHLFRGQGAQMLTFALIDAFYDSFQICVTYMFDKLLLDSAFVVT